MRDLSVSPSTRIAGEKSGVGRGGVELADALGLGDSVEMNPSGGALTGNAVMVTGLARIGEAFKQVSTNGKQRALGHASSGPCLQQNLVCVLEAR
jgi:acetyl-CoA acetyltransferase